MSKFDRSDRIALIALSLVLFSIVLVAWAVAFSHHEMSETIGRKQDAHVEQNTKNDISQPVASGDDFNFWRDPFPQWVMAVFTIVATAISWKAVVFIRDTLEETRKAVKAADDAVVATREIGQAQVRAYITVSRSVLSQPIADSVLTATVMFKNTGQSPAKSVRGWYRVTMANPERITIKRPKNGTVSFALIGAGQEEMFPNAATSARPISADNADKFYGGGTIYLVGRLDYVDVFGDDRWLEFRYEYRHGREHDWKMVASRNGNRADNLS